jgi:hypothetical protein
MLASLLVYLFGLIFTTNYVLVFIVTILLLAADFYYLKNVAGRRLVGLRWWNEVNGSSGDSHWVFESAPQPNEPGGKVVTPTDKRFFWLALYAQPGLWVALAIVAIVKIHFIWLTLVGMLRLRVLKRLEESVLTTIPITAIALVLTVTNTLAFSRCDKFSQASGVLETGFYSTSLARNIGGAMVSRIFNRS